MVSPEEAAVNPLIVFGVVIPWSVGELGEIARYISALVGIDVKYALPGNVTGTLTV